MIGTLRRNWLSALAEPEPDRLVFAKFERLLRTPYPCPKPSASQSTKSSEHLRPPIAPLAMPNPKSIML
jgi:hypothetical protein